MKRIVIVGATSTIATECARIWNLEDNVEFILVARDKSKAKRITKDLQVRNPNNHSMIEEIDFEKPKQIESLVEEVASKPIDTVLIAHGILPNQKEAQSNPRLVKEAISINASSVAMFAECFASEMQFTGGTIGVIGSVAGDRGRKTNYLYGASKALVETFTRGLAHRFAGTSLKIVLIKPGPTATAMTAELTQKGQKQANPSLVAAQIVKGMKAGKPVIYTPGIWRWIMLIIKHLPSQIFNRLNI
ncbi:MAG: SDR family NAD(P)-dependent oxidoreductase [Actinobacteria bacterium]|nr:SDR family NAD(P)-dependent oxidoreductase [Actinomycetota bacterium]